MLAVGRSSGCGTRRGCRPWETRCPFQGALGRYVIEDLSGRTIATWRVASGTAIRIMTDAFVPVELSDAGGQTILKGVEPGANIRRRGEDMKAGQSVLTAGTRMGAAEIGVLASVQKTQVLVR